MSKEDSASRKEHLQWCKDRAMEYLEKGNYAEAYTSFISDTSKHSETRNHPALELGTKMFFGGMLSSYGKLKYWIEGFN